MQTKTSWQYYDMLDDEGMFDELGKRLRNPRPVRPGKLSTGDQQFVKR
jgi:hypothetical protein